MNGHTTLSRLFVSGAASPLPTLNFFACCVEAETATGNDLRLVEICAIGA